MNQQAVSAEQQHPVLTVLVSHMAPSADGSCYQLQPGALEALDGALAKVGPGAALRDASRVVNNFCRTLINEHRSSGAAGQIQAALGKHMKKRGDEELDCAVTAVEASATNARRFFNTQRAAPPAVGAAKTAPRRDEALEKFGVRIPKRI